MKAGRLKFFLTGFLLTTLIFVGGILCLIAKSQSAFGALIWLPTGLSFTFLFLVGLEFWPFVYLGDLLVHFYGHLPPLFLVCAPISSVTINYFLARYLRKLISSKLALSRLRDLFIFLLIGVLLDSLLVSSINVILFLLLVDNASQNPLSLWRDWWIADGMATLVVGGFLINWINFRNEEKPELLQKKWEALFVFFAILGTCIFLFTPLADYNHSLLVKPYFLYTLMLWASLRFNLLGATLTSMIMVLTSLIGETYGFVAFSTSNIDPSDRMVMLQLLIATIAFTGMVVASTVREKTEALEAKNEFLDIASHELKTPITSLKLQLQLLQKRIEKNLNPTPADIEQKHFLVKVERQVNRLVKIVEQLLDVSRVERDLVELDREDVNLTELIQQLSDRLSSDLQAAKCQLKLSLEDRIYGSWDPFRLEQVFENLISNAIKYAPGQPIEVSSSLNGAFAEIKVKDQGPGIEPTKLPTIFDRFIRASEIRHVQGLGLGLFITRRIIEAHGGTISVKSAPGQGSTFSVLLPLNLQPKPLSSLQKA